MKDKTIAIYVFLDDIMIKIKHKEPENRHVNDSEIITTALIAALYFHGNIDHAINFVKTSGLMPNMLSKSRFNRRIHSILELIINTFFCITQVIKELNISSKYIIDSFPVPVCKNIRISRSKILKGKQYRGYKASMREYFYGVTVQVITTVDGIPVEFAILPGCYHDIDGLKNMFLDLPQGSTLFGDSAYTDYNLEETCMDAENIRLMIDRKRNSQKPHKPWENGMITHYRKKIETVFSQISYMFPKRIHAVTSQGLVLKIILFIFVFTINEKYL